MFHFLTVSTKGNAQREVMHKEFRSLV